MATPNTGNLTREAVTSHNDMNMETLECGAFWSNIAVVAFGVLAAFAAGFALYFSSRLAAAKDAELTRFQSESRVSIAAADLRAAEANEKAAVASATAASVNERAGRLELEAAQQHERAAKAERDLLEVRERLAPRVLSADQIKALGAALRPYGAIPVQIFTYSDVTEVTRIANWIGEGLSGAGWQVGVAQASGGVTVTDIVVALSKAASPEAKKGATALVGQLRAAGIESDVSRQSMEDIPGPGMTFGSTVPNPQVRILIGTK